MQHDKFRHKTAVSRGSYTDKTATSLKHEINQISLISGEELSSLKVCYHYHGPVPTI